MNNDGGPAFPVAESHQVAAGIEWTRGMSLLDRVAIQMRVSEDISMDTAIAFGGPPPTAEEGRVECMRWVAKWQARWRYIQAEAMIEERELRRKK